MYNVFKRPMFKRGGTAQGSGIMSYVEPRQEPRIMASMGFPTFGLSQGVDPASVERFKQAEAERKARIGQSFDFRGPALTDPDYNSKVQQFGSYNKYLDDARKKEQAEISSLKNELTSITEQNTQEYARKAKEEADRRAREKEIKAAKISKGFGDIDKTKEMTKEEEIDNEAKYLKKLLEDKNMTKGEIALILAESLATPGGFNKKLATARNLAIPLAREKSKEAKAYKLEAYKRFKDKEEAQIKYGQPTTSAKDIKNIAKARYQQHVIDTGGKPTKTMADIEREYIVERSKSPSETRGGELLDSAAKTAILPAIDDIRLYSKNLRDAELTKDKKSIERARKNLEDSLGKLSTYQIIPEFKGSIYEKMLEGALSGTRVNKKNGGRIGYAYGSPMSNNINTEEDTNNPEGVSQLEVEEEQSPTGIVGEKPVQKLDYTTLRTRLPKEINDQVVALLASSEAALQDFAYITTQNDVNNFNIKYGVNLIIPPTTQQV
jgi:hypothetical protein